MENGKWRRPEQYENITEFRKLKIRILPVTISGWRYTIEATSPVFSPRMSTSSLYIRAAQCFLLMEQAIPLEGMAHWTFWQMLPAFVPDPAAHLPALAAAVRWEKDAKSLLFLASRPLPAVIPDEATAWYRTLMANWELFCHRTSPYNERIPHLALVRLDSCETPADLSRPSRLPEWLRHARRWAGYWWDNKTQSAQLSALAAWRPGFSAAPAPEVLREWAGFWLKWYHSESPDREGIAAKALLNLLDGETTSDCRGLFHGAVPPDRLLKALASSIADAVQRTDRTGSDHLDGLDWQPVHPAAFPTGALAEVARTWLEATRHREWFVRKLAWPQVMGWNRTGRMSLCGIDLLPHVVAAVQKEGVDNNDILLELCQWAPEPGIRPEPAQLHELETCWQERRRCRYYYTRAAAWWAGIQWQRAGLATEPVRRFGEEYLAAVAEEQHVYVLSVLAQWVPDSGVPLKLRREWQRRWEFLLEDSNASVRRVASVALARQALEKGTYIALRRAELEAWCAGLTGREGGLNGLVARFHEVEAALAAGTVPEFNFTEVPPAERQHPQLALPPGKIQDGTWKTEQEGLHREGGPEMRVNIRSR